MVDEMYKVLQNKKVCEICNSSNISIGGPIYKGEINDLNFVNDLLQYQELIDKLQNGKRI